METAIEKSNRPDEITRDQIIKIADSIVTELLQWGTKWARFNSRECMKDDLVDVIEDYQSGWDNGYELAKKLEDKHGWRPDSTLVEILEGIDSHYDDELNTNIKQWVKANSIMPEKKQGDTVKVSIRGSIVEGVIVNIYHDRAIYVVNTEGTTNGGYLIAYEDLK